MIFKNLLFATALFLAPTDVYAQDVYNFQFQKAPAVVHIIPAATPSPITEVPAQMPDSSTLKTFSSIENLKAEPTSPWAIGVAMTSIRDAYQNGLEVFDRYGNTARRYAVISKYHLNKYFAADGVLAFPLLDDSFQRASGAGWSDSIFPAIGMTATPIHIDLFGYETVRIGVAAGAMLPQVKNYFLNETPARRVSWYFGYSFGIHLSPKISVEYALRATPKRDSFSYEFLNTTGVNFRF